MQPTMAVKIHQHLLLCSFLSLFFTIHASLHLHPSDLNTLTSLQNHLGVNVTATNQPCNTDGVFCERRLSNDETYVLRITKLLFNSKQLKGKLSPLIGRFTELKELSLSHNKFVDRIPASIFDCRKLEILNLSNNLFSGEVTSEFSSLIRLRILDISSNNLSGNLNFLRYFPNLETLSIANNFFTGRVPSSVRSFRNLRHFNFSGNRFLEASVSLDQRLLEFQNTDTTPNPNDRRHILAENHSPAFAPSYHHKKPAHASAPGPSVTVQGQKHKKTKKRLIGLFVGFIIGAFGATHVVFIFPLLVIRVLALVKGKGKGKGKGNGKGCCPTIYSPLIKKAEDLAFLEKEDALASMELIGKGGCGEVYKAELPGSNGKGGCEKESTSVR